ncbi:MAG: tetratricopeptide repeat protein, partial [Kaistella sp.]
KNIYLERLAAQSYYEMGDKTDKEAYNKGWSAINDFFTLAGPNFKYLGTDYKYKGMYLMKQGQDSLGILEMEKGIALDPSIATEVYSEIANTSYRAKKYDRAITYFEKKAAADKKTMSNNDWFTLGRSFYYSGTAKQTEAASIKDAKKKAAKEEEGLPFFVKADSAFSELVRVSATPWPTAFAWRGRANFQLDLKMDKDLAKGFYEKVITTVKPEEKATTYKSNVVEAYEYLGYYYVTKKDKAKSDEMFNALKEIDPANEKAKAYFNPPKQTQKPK